jgi:hypothetical protein
MSQTNAATATKTATKSVPASRSKPAAKKAASKKASKKAPAKTSTRTAASGKSSKMDQARAIYARNPKAERSVLVQKFMEQIKPKISAAGASTYASIVRAN